MITIDLFKCCKECNDADLDIHTTNWETFDCGYSDDNIIYCKHQKVCKHYDESSGSLDWRKE